MKTLLTFSLLFLLQLPFYTVSGQSIIPKYEIGINAGVFIYQGDLTPNALGSYNTMKPGFGLFAARNINNHLAVRLNFMRGRLKGDDDRYNYPAWRQQRNLNFNSPVTELSGTFVWNVLGLKPNEAGIVNFSPYFFGGLGYSFLNINRDWSKFNYSHFSSQTGIISGLTEDINQKMPKGIFVIPVGVGVRYGISEKLSFTLESTYRLTTTDYIDGFSKAANPQKADHYQTITAGLIWSFGKRNKLGCPVVKN